MKDNYDVVVIGAGPAGSISAKVSAENGLSVLLLEKDREVGIPVRCAEGVGKVGLTEFFEPDPKWISSEIFGARLYAPNGKYVELKSDEKAHQSMGYILDRKIFDKMLALQAVKAGAELIVKACAVGLLIENDYVVGVKFNHLGKEYSVRSKIVIGADGIESRVGRWAGIKTHIKLKDFEPCIQYVMHGVRTEKNFIELHFGNDIAPKGYLWVFPKGDDVANVGIGIIVKPNKDSLKKPKYYLDKFISKRFPSAKILSIVAGGVPVAETLDEITANGLMLVGDSAHQVNPVTGAGIINGMIAGKLAGETAFESFQKGDFSKKFLKRYEKQWHNRIGKKLHSAYIIKETIVKFTDQHLNDTAEVLLKTNLENLKVIDVFKTALKHNPKLILEVGRMFV